MFSSLRLIITPEDFHFAKWEVPEFSKYFKQVIATSKPHRILRDDDILLNYAYPQIMKHCNVRCRAKFGMLYPGWRFRPWKQGGTVHKIKYLALKHYSAIFINDGPVALKLEGSTNIHKVPFSADHNLFKKTRTRKNFKRLIQVGRPVPFKGRHISEAVMKMLPYEGVLYPPNGSRCSGYTIQWQSLVDIYQDADGFISPNMIGPSPKYDVDAKYNQSTMEAGLSGCIIFWHDCMNLGNSFETVFPISLEPKEIAQRIQDVVSSIDLDKHSTLTAQEFYEKCNAEQAVRAKVEIMKRYL